MPSKHAGRPAGGELGGRVLRRSHLACCPAAKPIYRDSKSPELFPRIKTKRKRGRSPARTPLARTPPEVEALIDL